MRRINGSAPPWRVQLGTIALAAARLGMHQWLCTALEGAARSELESQRGRARASMALHRLGGCSYYHGHVPGDPWPVRASMALHRLGECSNMGVRKVPLPVVEDQWLCTALKSAADACSVHDTRQRRASMALHHLGECSIAALAARGAWDGVSMALHRLGECSSRVSWNS